MLNNVNFRDLFFICGPCAMQSRAFALESAQELKELFEKAGLFFIYKSSFDKANRSSASGYRGIGMDEGLSVLDEIRKKLDVPVITDIHEPWQAEHVSQVVDVLQTPAFLCRQTDLITAAAATGKLVNIKKGQFLAPWDIRNILEKARSASNNPDQFMICERGVSFGYGNLVVDMRGLQIMSEICPAPLVFDATHSVQLPGAMGNSSGGERRYVPCLARAAIATKAVSGLFLEAHPEPDKAPCDGPNMLPTKELPVLLNDLKALFNMVHQNL